MTVAADDAELSERKIGCRLGRVHFSKASRNAISSLPTRSWRTLFRYCHRIPSMTEALERLMEEDAAADRPFIAALAIGSKARGTSHKPHTLLTAFDRPHFLIGKSEMVTNFMHQNMSNNRIQRELTSRPKIEDRIPIEKNPIGQVSGRRILCVKLGATVKCTQNTEFVF